MLKQAKRKSFPTRLTSSFYSLIFFLIGISSLNCFFHLLILFAFFLIEEMSNLSKKKEEEEEEQVDIEASVVKTKRQAR